ncbi:hypothetical protein BGW38_005932 [Lunasporangiospora selenospora]|uniref:Flavin-nucleotide-binding protein n=1 Tax=Lunasporangiospora selenospora TaxID=979761 RepID=A0A9P6FNI4_9FUNG|nr:hypothetical protein BGW38_005932 [Lunasporangiospora selenospora]
MTESYTPSSHKAINQVHRQKDRALYDAKSIFEILDDNILAHVGFTLPPGTAEEDDWPFVMPMCYGRIEDTVYIHGFVSGRMMKALATEPGPKVCITVTEINGLVVAMSPFHNSMNYKSAVIFGHGRLVEDPEEKDLALTVITNQPFRHADRWYDSRPPNSTDLKSTKVIAVQIEKASAKSRYGPVSDDRKDKQDPEVVGRYYAGTIPMKTVYGTPEPAEYNVVDTPKYLLPEAMNREQ